MPNFRNLQCNTTRLVLPWTLEAPMKLSSSSACNLCVVDIDAHAFAKSLSCKYRWKMCKTITTAVVTGDNVDAQCRRLNEIFRFDVSSAIRGIIQNHLRSDVTYKCFGVMFNLLMLMNGQGRKNEKKYYYILVILLLMLLLNVWISFTQLLSHTEGLCSCSTRDCCCNDINLFNSFVCSNGINWMKT